MVCRFVNIIFFLPVRYVLFVHIVARYTYILPADFGERDIYSASQTTVSHMKRLNQTESTIFVIFMCSLFPKAILFDIYLLVHKVVYMYFEARLCMCARHFPFCYGD